MKWELSSAERFIEHQEFIDTAIIPVVKMELGEVFKTSIAKATWLTGVANGMEEQLTGRVMLFPAYTYIEKDEPDALTQRLHTYRTYFQEHQFKHVVFIILDGDGLTIEEEKLDFLLTNLPDEDSIEFSEEDMERFAQKLVSKLINLWQK